MRKAFALFLLCAFPWVGGCGVFGSPKEAEAVAAQYFEAVKAGDWDRALGFYGPRFFEKTTPSQWAESLKKIREKLGPLASYKLVNWQIHYQAGQGQGTYTVLIYDVSYSKFPSRESLTLFKPPGGKNQILGYNINSEGFLK